MTNPAGILNPNDQKKKKKKKKISETSISFSELSLSSIYGIYVLSSFMIIFTTN